jgi:hypothetical protein
MASIESPTAPTCVPTSLDEVLRAVNRIRATLGADPIYELPRGRPAREPASTCVLERAREDVGVSSIDYRFARGKRLEIEHGLGSFIRAFDAGKYPELLDDGGSR